MQDSGIKVLHSKSPPSRRLQWIFALTGILLLFLFAIIGYGYFIAVRFQTYHLPLMTSIEKIEEATNDCHRIAADVARRLVIPAVETVLKPLDEDLSSFRNILEAEAKLSVRILPEDGLIQSEQIKQFIARANNYRDTLTRWLQIKIPTDELQRRYEDSYMRFLRQTDELEESILQSMTHSRSRFQKTMIVLIGVCIILAVVVACSFKRYEKRNLENYIALEHAHEGLQEEIRERMRVESELRQGELLFHTVFETSPDPIILTRYDDGCIVDINSSFAALTGFNKNEVLGKTVLELDVWHDLEQRELLLSRLDEAGAVRNWEAVFRIKDGGSRTTLISAKVITIDGKPHILTVVRDISDRKVYEKKIRASIRFLNKANRHTGMRPLWKAFIEEIRNISGCEAVAIRILDDDGQVPYAETHGFSSDFCKLEEALSIHSEQGMCARVIAGKQNPHAHYFTSHGTYFVGSTSQFLDMASDEQLELMRNTCHRFGFETLALIPIRAADRIIGLIHVADTEKDRLSQFTVEILEAASLQLGTAIQRVSIEDALQKSHAELEGRVKHRTELLALANESLLREIEERKQTEQELIRHREQLRHLSSDLMQTEERERRRIATEIHDRIGQALAVTKIKLGALQSALVSEERSAAVEEIRELVSGTIKDTRSLTFELSPPVLYELGLKAALDWLADNIKKRHGIQIKISGSEHERLADISLRIALFRIIRELVYNIVKHSNAKQASIELEADRSVLCIRVEDNGSGFDPSALISDGDSESRGFGLFSIREQLNQCGGELNIQSMPGRGTQVTITVSL